MEEFKKYINSLAPISDELFVEIKNKFVSKKYKAKTILCKINDTPKNIYFIKSGYIRAYTVDEKGKEYTKSLFRANQFAASLSALIKNTPSKLNYETITDCEIVEGEYQVLRSLANENLDISRIALRLLEYFYLGIESKLFEFTTKDATERYLNLLKRFDGIEKLVPQYQIATILSITPIQLSRIRHKLKNG